MNDYQKFWLEYSQLYGVERAQYMEQLFWDAELANHWENYFQLEFPKLTAHKLFLLTNWVESAAEKAIECFQLYSNSQILRHPGDRWNFDVQFRVDWWAL